MNDRAMRAEAVAEAGGRIVAVGSKASVMKLKGPSTQLIDLKGRALLPGFVDAHGHMMGGGVQALSANLLAPPDGNVKDMASLQATLREWMAVNDAAVKKVNLVIGFGYDNVDAGRAAPSDPRRSRCGLAATSRSSSSTSPGISSRSTRRRSRSAASTRTRPTRPAG